MARADRPIITFLSDFGTDGAVATCKGVMLSICRDAQIVDVAHSIRKYAISDGAFLLRFALPYSPVGTHVGVVDPGVGTTRRPIGIQTGRGDVLIGPDNGLLPSVADVLGGAIEARELTNTRLWRSGISTTFHGRDIFAPVAAHLAAGDAPFEAVGESIPLEGLVRVQEPEAIAHRGEIETAVTYVDSFGNVRLAGGREELVAAFGDPPEGMPLEVTFADPEVHERTHYATTFGAVGMGQSLVYIDSLGNLAMADNQGNLAARLGLGHDRPARISRA
jgi:S-adenosylmethionine hydrolase